MSTPDKSALWQKLGWAAALVICTGYVAYIVQLTCWPFQDYPNHVARGATIADLLFHHGAHFGQIFDFRLTPVPYILHDLILATCVELFGHAGGAGVFNTLVLLSLPCALLFYMHVNGLVPRAWLLIFLMSLYLSTDWFFLMGFTAFRLSLVERHECLSRSLPHSRRVSSAGIVRTPHIHATAAHRVAFLARGIVCGARSGRSHPQVFSRDRGDPMTYFRYRRPPYMPDVLWYTARVSPPSASKQQQRWKMIEQMPVDWNRIACDYDFLLTTMPFEVGLVRVPIAEVAANETAALFAVDKQACHPH